MDRKNSKNFSRHHKKSWKYVISLISLLIFLQVYADTQSKLPKTEILGKEYYYYEVKKGESVYGIAKKLGWDLEELLRLNPDASGEVSKGTRLYYPTGQVTVVTEMPEPVEIDNTKLEPIRHKVKKGETVYSISRQYNVPLETIYKFNPSTKKGVKNGDIIEIPQKGNTQYYYYTIKRGDTLSKIAQNYNTSVEDILKNNAGLTVNNLHEGETIRITLNSNIGKVKTELVAEEQVTQISGYKVSKNETWEDISEKTGVEVEVLKEANSETTPKENSVVNVPVVETIEVEKTTVYEEPEEMTFEQVQNLYDSIKGVNDGERLFEGVKMAVILDEPSSKKDIDFVRGMLIGLSEMKNVPYKIDYKVIDGRVSTGDLIDALDDYEPTIIVSTADKAFPLFLADYGNTNNIQIVNVFDLKNDLYEDNSSMVQLLPPSGFFYDRLATYIYKDNRRRKLIAVGEEDENDGMASELFRLYDGAGDKISLEEFGMMEPDILQPILIYSYASKKEDVSDFITNVTNLAENNPGLDFRIVGRSSWIAMIDDFGDQFEEYSVYVPSRVWLDENSEEWDLFTKQYEEFFGGNPVRSIPNFAASGYDVIKYFIPLVAENQGDFNKTKQTVKLRSLQNDIELSRVNNWGGFINDTGYLIRFRPGNSTEKIIVK